MFKLIENKLIEKVEFDEYKKKVRAKYEGKQGAWLATASMLSLHIPLGEKLLKRRKFDLTGVKRLLDVGSGAGQIAGHVLKYADPGTEMVCFDLSPEMIRRARERLASDVPYYVNADLTKLPFADGTFDCVTCGYVLEYFPDPRIALKEMARVLMPGGRMLLLATEDSFFGSWNSRIWACRTYNRRHLREVCHEVGLAWRQELWFTWLHKALKMGGICVELTREGARHAGG